MCLEDVKIGRVTTGRSGSTVISNANATQLLGASKLRFCLVISPPNGQRVTIKFGEQPVLDDGLTLQAGSTPMQLGLDDVGAVIGQQVWAIVSGGAPLNVGWLDCSFDEGDL